MSGWKQPRPEGFKGATAEEVKANADKIDHELEPHPFDKDFPGQYNASHAEKQMSVVSPDHPIGVSKPMCTDCQNYFSKLSKYNKADQVVTDPDGTWLFKPDGSMVKPGGSNP